MEGRDAELLEGERQRVLRKEDKAWWRRRRQVVRDAHGLSILLYGQKAVRAVAHHANGFAQKVSKRMFGNYVQRVSKNFTVHQIVVNDIQPPALPNEHGGQASDHGSYTHPDAGERAATYRSGSSIAYCHDLEGLFSVLGLDKLVFRQLQAKEIQNRPATVDIPPLGD
jgi:hypothetical protein